MKSILIKENMIGKKCVLSWLLAKELACQLLEFWFNDQTNTPNVPYNYNKFINKFYYKNKVEIMKENHEWPKP
jgi:poly(3-hydroxyalkanoate) synthetase